MTLSGLRPPRHVPGYEQERFLGRGAFGEVWVAVDGNSGRKVAIKYYHRRGGLDWSLLSREVEKLRYLFGDRHVVQLLQVGWESDPPFYVMEYMERGSLEDLLRDGPLSVEDTLTMFRGVATGLIHAHGKGVLHCDLKPANVMLDQDGQPRLADFGQSRLTHEHSPALGTLFYMAPEQADLHAAPDVRWDVYALGAVGYRMLTGEPPYRTPEAVAAIHAPGTLEERLTRYRQAIAAAPKPTAHRSVPGVDAALAAILEKCLAADPQHRFPNVQAVLSALDARAAARARRPLLILGGVGPLLVLLIILVLAGYEFARVLGVAEQELKTRTLEGDQLIARAEADRLGWEVRTRWQVLQQEAADKTLQRALAAATGQGDPPGVDLAELNRWFRARHEYWDRAGPSVRSGVWVACDRLGYIRGCSEPGPEPSGAYFTRDGILNTYFGFRDYFHGTGRDLPKSVTRPADGPTPITRPHRSVVFRQIPQGTYAVAYSVPVPSPTPGDPTPVGVLIMIVDLVGPTKLTGDRDRFSVLIDARPDENGRAGLLVRHPYQEQYADHPIDLPLVYAPEVVAKAGTAGAYTDPVGGRFGGAWLAAVEPARIPEAPPETRDTGWIVVVQESEAGLVQPIRTLRGRLAGRALTAVLLVVGVLALMWGFVMVVLNAAPASRVVRYIRRRVGLKSGGSASSAAGGTSSVPGSGSKSGGASGPSGSSG